MTYQTGDSPNLEQYDVPKEVAMKGKVCMLRFIGNCASLDNQGPSLLGAECIGDRCAFAPNGSCVFLEMARDVSWAAASLSNIASQYLP